MIHWGNLVPLLILLIVVAGLAWFGYQLYLWSNEMTDRGKKHMEKKHMTFTKEGGLKVEVKELRNEEYSDRTQKTLVNVWNNASFPAANDKNPSLASRPTSSQSVSQRPADSRTSSSAHVSAPTQRPTAQTHRTANSIPGGFDE